MSLRNFSDLQRLLAHRAVSGEGVHERAHDLLVKSGELANCSLVLLTACSVNFSDS